MASSLFFSTPIPTKLISKQKPFSYHSPNPLLPQLTHKTLRSLVVSSAAAIEAETETSSSNSTPLKSLPFRVGHGFDLHRLEPGYPLIIGGINIPHDRGCEAHSDGNFDLTHTHFFAKAVLFTNF
ncbi:hypothetical protein AABB24_014971 [Solanum stoloniferum]|uniref:2-C-methyl-D-erythritol 2,4-cyclodiphosphate synthase domain-containing protein n=1 Tax=Solanum stoloniferum TaxID=62892 RepID=A0ABD2U0Q3_9SOLN